jgi:8-oxo-dGTP pyrophosphatase MutT (NUDIX family)
MSNDSIISVGIVCFKLDPSIYNTFLNNIQNISYYNLNDHILKNIDKYEQYNKNIKFLLIKRKYSFNYIDFIRGNYNINDIDNTNLDKIFSLMSKSEIELIKNNDFTKLWNDLWLKNAYKKKYLDEMIESNKKFNYLKNSGFFNNIYSNYDTTEWEIPKGRKNLNETNLNCAIREFKEETTLENKDYTLINIIDPTHDTFIGTNGKEYKHIFYHSLVNENINDINYSNHEIDSVNWCSWSELYDYIRPYNKNKINILTIIFLFIINICELFKKTMPINNNVNI